MREIKFRAWDKEEKRFLPGYFYNQLSINPEGKVIWYSAEKGLEDLSGQFNIMQYTGLKDKNGKEIYEGDILKRHEHEDPIEVGSLIPIDRFYGMYETPHEDDWMSWYHEYEVIGNIHDTPELLETQNG